MNACDIPSADTSETAPMPHVWLLDLLVIVLVVFIPNLIMALRVEPATDSAYTISNRWLYALDAYHAMDSAFYVQWLTMNILLLGLLVGVRTYLLQPLQRIVSHVQIVRLAYANTEMAPSNQPPLTMQLIARDVGRFAAFAIEYYRKHQDVCQELEQARSIIGQFTQHQQTVLSNTNREIGTQYRSVLAYANYLEEQILSNKLDPSLRYDFDDVCESSFNLKLIAGALSMLSTPPDMQSTTVHLANLMQQTMLTLAPALDRRSMKLTTAEVDMEVAAQGDPQCIAHIVWMMLLGMIRYAADESTLRMRCLYNREGTQTLLSIVVTELSPLQLSETERGEHLMRQLQHLTPHMFAETIRIHGNVQLANLLIARLGGTISILPLTVSSCEICMTLPAAEIAATASA